jgi:hypothetical protein
LETAPLLSALRSFGVHGRRFNWTKEHYHSPTAWTIAAVASDAYWPQHGWRAEVVVDDLAGSDIINGEFVETR